MLVFINVLGTVINGTFANDMNHPMVPEEPGSSYVYNANEDTCNLQIFVDKTDVGAAANASASISVEGGTPPYSYYWTTGDTTNAISDITAGKYYIVVVDAKGCRAWALVDINNLAGPQIQVSNIQPVSCYGEKDGSIEIEIIGGTPPYRIRWSNGEQGTLINGLESAYYNVAVVDAQGMKSFKKIYVPHPSPLQIASDITPSHCKESDGSLYVTARGGTPPYTYTWLKDMISGPELLNRPAGVYPLLVEDANGCILEKMVTLSDVEGPVVLVDTVVSSSCLEDNGFAEVNVESPTGVTYKWWDGLDIISSGPTATGLTKGNYVLTMTDENDCKTVRSVQVDWIPPDPEPICVLTIDTATDANLIVWKRKVNALYYNIYRETVEDDNFMLVGSVPFTDLNVFEDTIANPHEKGFAYKITSVDECGTESVLSEVHKLCHLSVIPFDQNTSILIWDAYQGVSGIYEMQRRTTGGEWETVGEVPHYTRVWRDDKVPTGERVEYRVRIPLPEECVVELPFKKVGSGSYSYTLSNVEDNRASATNINKLIAENLFRVYPNPSNGYLRLVMDLPLDEEVRLGIYDLSGRPVMKRSINPSEFQMLDLDLSQQPSGIYVIHAMGKSFNFRKKLIIR